MNYLILIVGIMFEALGTTMLKMISGIKDYKHIIASMIGYGLGMSGYMYSLKNIGLSVTSAFWNGLGITCTTLIAFLFFHESFNVQKALGIAMVIRGCVILSLSNH